MQLSQFCRRGIVRPLDDCASRQLAAFRIDTPIRVEWLQIMNENEFGEIWESGILQNINAACRLRISDYEETELPTEKIHEALQALRESTDGGSLGAFFQNLDAVFCDALLSKRHVYFVL